MAAATERMAEVADYQLRHGEVADEDTTRVDALLLDAEALVCGLYERKHGRAWQAGWSETFDRNAKAVCCSMVARVMNAPRALDGATQMSQTVGSYTASVSYATPSASLYVMPSELARLGLRGSAVRFIQGGGE